jgi:hypothetical protein
MWSYKFKHGIAHIVQQSGTYFFEYDGILYTGCRTPEAVADDAYCAATGCDVWDDWVDSNPVEAPSDLSYWESYYYFRLTTIVRSCQRLRSSFTPSI